MNTILFGFGLTNQPRRNLSLWKLRLRHNLAQTIALLAGTSVVVASMWVASPCLATSYIQHNLVSDLSGVATHTDPNLVNPWGIASSATSPFWVSDNHTGVSTLYNGSGTPRSLVVTIPPPAGGTPPSAPTGVVFNGTSDFQVAGPGTAAHFIFATEDGTVAGWNSGTNAVREVDNSASGAVYKGLAIGNNGSGNFLYAANFNSAAIDVFNGTYSPTLLAGHFTDPNLPAGYAPFNIQNIGGTLFVTYALQNAAKHDDVAGAGHGFIDEFDLNGNLLKRFASNGVLNSPWGLALAPASFGSFANDLLVGNFGDGRINAFDPSTGTFLGSLTDASNNPIAIEGLWGLRFGNGGNGGDPGTLFFSAGIPGPGGVVEDHGLFGSITVPDSGATLGLMIVGLGGLAACGCALRQAQRGSIE
jgi:uncharacterized protein (TIGR03118 family)